ncbi:MAG: response regulator, partial [Planctomycetes bacterium]|nr:response regulator [Planctomycetota bacterium]
MSIDILIVEDSRLQAELLRGRLQAAGYEVRVAGDGRLALEQIRQRKPTLVVSDINMPTMDGYTLCQTIKQDADLRGIPVILLSGLDDPEDIIRGLDAGADNYITKACTPDYLLARVEAILSTPIEVDESPNEPLEVTLHGKTYTVDAGRRQVLNLLVSTFQDAVEKNRELIR